MSDNLMHLPALMEQTSTISRSEMVARARQLLPLLDGLAMVDIHILFAYTEWLLQHTAPIGIQPAIEVIKAAQVVRDIQHATEACTPWDGEPIPHDLQGTIDRLKAIHHPLLQALKLHNNDT